MASKLARPVGGWPIARAGDTLGVSLPDGIANALGRWLDLLATWNARVDLTAARSPDELVDLMLADAMVLSTRVPANARVIDVGTGAGAPGLALAVLRPDLDVTLVEPLAKRSAFLRTVIGTLKLSRVALDPHNGDQVATRRSGAWEVALARATLGPTEWLALASRLVTDTGAAWAFLAKEPNPTHADLAVVEEVAYVWPLTGAKRRLVRYARPPAGGGGRTDG